MTSHQEHLHIVTLNYYSNKQNYSMQLLIHDLANFNDRFTKLHLWSDNLHG